MQRLAFDLTVLRGARASREATAEALITKTGAAGFGIGAVMALLSKLYEDG